MKRFTFVVLTVLAAVALLACPRPVCPAWVPVDIDADVSPYPEWPTEEAAQVPVCVSACKRLKQLGCPEAEPIDGGDSCYMICKNAETSGHFSLNPRCVAAASSVPVLWKCGTVRCKK